MPTWTEHGHYPLLQSGFKEIPGEDPTAYVLLHPGTAHEARRCRNPEVFSGRRNGQHRSRVWILSGHPSASRVSGMTKHYRLDIQLAHFGMRVSSGKSETQRTIDPTRRRDAESHIISSFTSPARIRRCTRCCVSRKERHCDIQVTPTARVKNNALVFAVPSPFGMACTQTAVSFRCCTGPIVRL